MLDRLLVMFTGSVLLAAISVQLLLFCFPLLRRLEFDVVCHQYALLMDQAGGLDAQSAASLAAELGRRGFLASSVEAPARGNYGELMQLRVSAGVPGRHLSATLHMEEETTCFVYETKILCRVLQQPAGAQ